MQVQKIRFWINLSQGVLIFAIVMLASGLVLYINDEVECAIFAMVATGIALLLLAFAVEQMIGLLCFYSGSRPPRGGLPIPAPLRAGTF